MSMVKSDPNARFCPYPGCESVYYRGEGEEENKVFCRDCERPFCFNCRDVWHEGKTCVEYLKEKGPADKKTKKWMKRFFFFL